MWLTSLQFWRSDVPSKKWKSLLMSPTLVSHSYAFVAHSAYVALPVYFASLAAMLKNAPFEIVFL